MSTIGAVEYMEAARQEITQRRVYPFSCGLIAVDIAEILLKQERSPVVLGLRGQPLDTMGKTKPLVPKLLEGKVSWGGHLVCVEGGLAFDPLAAQPTDLEGSLAETFTEPVEVGRSFHDEELPHGLSEGLQYFKTCVTMHHLS